MISVPFNQEHTLIDSVQSRASAQEREKLISFWNLTGLPYPEKTHFYRGADADLIFLSPYSLVIAIRYAKTDVWGSEKIYEARHIRHKHILEPLYSMDLGPLAALEVLPGVKSGAGHGDLIFLQEVLAQDGIHFTDIQAENAGYLSANGELTPVVLDRGAIRLGKKPQTEKNQSFQRNIYGEYIDKIRDAVTQGNQRAFRTFFEDCRKNSILDENDPDKILFSPWIQAQRYNYKSEMISYLSHEYAKGL